MGVNQAPDTMLLLFQFPQGAHVLLAAVLKENDERDPSKTPLIPLNRSETRG